VLKRKQLKNLDKICQMPIDGFRNLGDCVDTEHGPMIHIDNGGNTLAAAHLDTVDSVKPKWKGKYRIQTPDLDDRLGVWVLLDLLPSLGVTGYDVLLCDSEEIGCSTAQFFPATDQYNWLFEFDRAGTDVVTYQYSDDHWDSTLASVGFDVKAGAFSDIAYLEHLGRKAVNVGVGYHRQHTRKCNADLRFTVANAMRFAEFYHKNKDYVFEHEQYPSKASYDSIFDDTGSACHCPWCFAECTEAEIWSDTCPHCRTDVQWQDWLTKDEMAAMTVGRD
jgi:hypothetical protein